MPWSALGQSSYADYAAPYSFNTWVGSYYDDLFGFPEAVAVDSDFNLYVAGSDAIFKDTPTGDLTVLAGTPNTFGANNGTGFAAQFNFGPLGYPSGPVGLAVDSSFNVYVADENNNEIRKVTPQGVVTTLAGLAGTMGSTDATGSAARFNGPKGVAVDANGNVYVADTYNQTIREVTPQGAVTTLAGQVDPNGNGANVDGTGTAAQFSYPEALAVDTAGNLYVADAGYHNSTIRKITPVGATWVVTTLAGLPGTDGSTDGTGKAAQFNGPGGIAVDSTGNVYVADSGNNTIRKVMPNGEVTTLAGVPGEVGTYCVLADGTYTLSCISGTGSAALFWNPCSVAVDGAGTLFVADEQNFSVRVGVAPEVQVVALEVTQVIQDWRNSIPLIEGKETFVRAHLQLAPSDLISIKVADALLYGTGPDGPLPCSPLHPINKPNNSVTVTATDATDPDVRGHIANSLNFRLPPSWSSGTITMRLAWPGGLQPINKVPDDLTVQATFVPAAVPRIGFFAINWTNAEGTPFLVGPILKDLPRRVLSCFPVASVTAVFGSLPWTSMVQPTVEEVNVLIASKQMLESEQVSITVLTNGYWNWIYHGAIPIDPDVDVKYDGLADGIPSFVSSSLVQDQYGVDRQTVSHELGHNLGRYHDTSYILFGMTNNNGTIHAYGACDEQAPDSYVYPLFQPFNGYPNGAPTLGPMTLGANYLIYGLDSLTLDSTSMEPVVAPTNSPTVDGYCFDVMSYCDHGLEDVWPSSVTYTNWFDSINAIFGPGPSMAEAGPWPFGGTRPKGGPQPQGGGGGITNYLIARGIMNFNAGTAQFLPCLPLTSTNVPPAPSPGTNFLLQAVDDSGAVLQAVEFALEPSIVERNDTNQTAVFIVALTDNPSIHSLELLYNGVLVATMTASPNAPTLTLTTPNGGQNFATGTVNVAWSGSDADGDALIYTVEYSADDGTTWLTLAVDLPGQTMGVDSSELGATTEGLIRVIATDGMNITIAQSAATFTVQPHAPSVWINAPQDGLVFIGNIQLFLDATVTDMQDGVLDGTNVQWTSDLDGALGDGDIVTFNARNLSEGYHTITVTATDSEGLTNSAVTHLFELHYPPPQLSVQALAGTTNATLSWPAYFTNYILQSSANLTSGWAAITNNPPVAGFSQQSVSVGISSVNTFFRLIFQP
jgi:sugar lactone lactonase YvrE